VLAGGGAALVLLCVWGQLIALRAEGQLLDLVRTAVAIGACLVVGLGWNVATAQWPPHRSRTAGAAT
jgi:hypothetical protein